MFLLATVDGVLKHDRLHTRGNSIGNRRQWKLGQVQLIDPRPRCRVVPSGVLSFIRSCLQRPSASDNNGAFLLLFKCLTTLITVLDFPCESKDLPATMVFHFTAISPREVCRVTVKGASFHGAIPGKSASFHGIPGSVTLEANGVSFHGNPRCPIPARCRHPFRSRPQHGRNPDVAQGKTSSRSARVTTSPSASMSASQQAGTNASEPAVRLGSCAQVLACAPTTGLAGS